MYCKRCGMDSKDAENCEWCKQPMIQDGPRPPGEAEPPAEAAPEAEVEAYVPEEGPRPRVAPPAAPMVVSGTSDAVRLSIALLAGLALGVVTVLIIFAITQQAPTKLYGGLVRLRGEGFPVAVLAGAIYGAIMGILLGGLLCLTRWGVAVGLPVGAVLGYCILQQEPFSYGGLISGALIGVVASLAGRWKYKKRKVMV